MKTHIILTLYWNIYSVLGIPSFGDEIYFRDVLAENTDPFRLPSHTEPISYEIHLIPYLKENSEKDFTFDGMLDIAVEVVAFTDSITLHAFDIIIDEDSVSVIHSTSGKIIPILAHKYDKIHEFYIIDFPWAISPGKYKINMKYSGQLNDAKAGFYRSSYTIQGKRRWLATTQFEATDARRAFPCFDEPAMKATFIIHLARYSDQVAISNMPLVRTSFPDSTINNRVWDTFASTKVMSTYTLAFVVSDFKFIGNDKYKIWAKPHAVEYGEYALSVSKPIMRVMEEFTDIEYHLPKMDQIAIPDFSAGAMENWGLVTYREFLLLWNQKEDSPTMKQTIATIIAHEFSHQWFGNLVTPRWWKWAWLNEAFARYFEYFATDKIEPSWELEKQFVTKEVQSIMKWDTRSFSHPLTNEVSNPIQITNMFSPFTYKKGGAIVRMVEHFLTYTTFQKGLINYLKSKSYSSAEANDLFDNLQAQATIDRVLPPGLTVHQILDTWTLQTGFPLITLSRDYENKVATIVQQRFNGSKYDNSSWLVPITFTSQKELQFNDTRTRMWSKRNVPLLLADLPGKDEWVILNIREVGFYRVNYDDLNWKLLLNYLNSNEYHKIHESNRAQILDDVNALVGIGLLNKDVFFNAHNYLIREKAFTPWLTASSNFDHMAKKLIGTDAFPAFKNYVLHLMKGEYERLGLWTRQDDSHLEILKREIFVEWACRFDEEKCTIAAEKAFNNWISTGKHAELSSKIRKAMYCNAVRNGGKKRRDEVAAIYRHSESEQQKMELIGILVCSKDTAVVNRYLDYSINDQTGQQLTNAFMMKNAILGIEDMFQPFQALSYTEEAANAARKFMRESHLDRNMIDYLYEDVSDLAESQFKSNNEFVELKKLLMKYSR